MENPSGSSCQKRALTAAHEKTHRALPFAMGSSLVAYLRYNRGDWFEIWKPARALPFACRLPHIGGREAADTYANSWFALKRYEH